MHNRLRQLCKLMIAALLIIMLPQTAVAQSSGFEFAIRIDGNTYDVYIRPVATPNAPNLTLTSQVTLKVPHAIGETSFKSVT
ncbi:MAG: hypothetical protein R2932_16575 [Caldilineaceae bacterium]